jgi:hypothetical protein
MRGLRLELTVPWLHCSLGGCDENLQLEEREDNTAADKRECEAGPSA